MKKAIATSSSATRGWLSTPGNPLLHWPPPPPPPQNPKKTKKQKTNNPENPNPNDLPSVIDSLCKSRSFDSAWSLLSSLPAPLPAFVPLFRRYSRATMTTAAIRSFQFFQKHPEALLRSDTDADMGTDTDTAFNLLLDALCKEGHSKVASSSSSFLPLSIRSHNILLHGHLRIRNLKRAQSLFDQMSERNVVTYGTLIKGLSHMRRPDAALSLLEDMRLDGLSPNHATCNLIVDSLSESARFSEALALVEKFPLNGISPNAYTYNSLVKGYCKHDDLVGASKVLKAMVLREILPSAKTYNYFKYFMRYRKVEEGMNLYNKMVSSGYSPDRLTYHLLVKMLCESEELDLAVQMVRAMNQSGFDSDLATSTMVVHLLIKLRRIDEACLEFEGLIGNGIVPQYITYRMLSKELRRLGMGEMERKVSVLMDSVPHSMKLPGSYRQREGDEVVGLRKSIMKNTRSMLEILKTCKDPKELKKLKGSTENAVESANKLIVDMKRRVYKVKSG